MGYSTILEAPENTASRLAGVHCGAAFARSVRQRVCYAAPRLDASDPRVGTHTMDISGNVVSGRGEAAGFTRLDWVVRQSVDHLGIDPYPGTLNLKLSDASSLANWSAIRSAASHVLEPPAGSGFCAARCHAFTLDGLPVAAVIPDVSGYPQDTLELIAAVHVREQLRLDDGSHVAARPFKPYAVRAVMFDVDGTLLDSVPAYFEIARLAVEPFGYAVSMEQIRHSLATAQSFWRAVVPEDVADRDAHMKTMSATARREWPRVLREQARPFEHVHAALATLHARGLKLGIVTSAQGEVIEVLRAFGLAHYFDAIVTGSDVVRRKPDPEGLVKCLEMLGIDPGEALYVGDTPLDVDASRAAGTRSLGVLTGAGDSAMLTRCGADRMLPHLGAIDRLIAAIDA